MTEPPVMPGSPEEAELRARFEVRTERFDHRDVLLELLVPVSVDPLIDHEAFERDERLPYWAELWPSARALARHLVERDATPAARVLELGCGVGLPSLVIAARGHQVLASDYEPDALVFTRVNAARNGIPQVSTGLLDWRAPPGEPKWELVLAADVLYERRNAAALAALLPVLLRPGGRLLLADPGRAYLTDFRQAITSASLGMRLLEERPETSAPTTGAVSRISILEIARRPA